MGRAHSSGNGRRLLAPTHNMNLLGPFHRVTHAICSFWLDQKRAGTLIKPRESHSKQNMRTFGTNSHRERPLGGPHLLISVMTIYWSAGRLTISFR